MRLFLQIVFFILVLVLFIEVLIVSPTTLDEMLKKTSPLSAQNSNNITASNPAEAEQKMGDIHLVESKQGQKDWELKASAALGFQGKGLWELEKVNVIFHSKEGVTFAVQGDAGTVESNTKNMIIRGHAITRSSNGYEFSSESIEYKAAERVLVSPKSVVMKGPPDSKGVRMALTGGSMMTTLNDSQMNILGNVEALQTVRGDKPLRITSEKAVFSGQSWETHFVGNVVMQVDEFNVWAPQADFQFDKTKNIIVSVVMSGGVKITDPKKKASSDHLKVNFLDNKYTLTGNPRVEQEGDELLGEQITFLEGGKRVKVEKANVKVVEENKPK